MTLSTNEALLGLTTSGIRRITAMAAEQDDCVMLTIGEPDANTDPLVKQAAIDALDANETHYPPNNGFGFLRKAISEHMATQGLTYAPEEVIVTNGATGGVFASLSCLINPGDEVIVLLPGYGLYECVVGTFRGTTVYLDTSTNDFQVTPAMLAGVASERTKAIVLNSPNNPTGCTLNAESLAAIAEFAAERDVFVVCDDVYAKLVYDEGFVRFASTYTDLRDRIIVCDSFSKPYAMTGWRIGWIAADERIVEQAMKVHQYSCSCSPAFVQFGAVKALDLDVEPAREVYRARREVMLRRLDEMGLEVVRPTGAFYAFPSIERFGLSSEEFCVRMLREAGVAVVPGDCFGADGFVRISYCCSMDAINTGLDRMESFIKKLG